VRLGIERYGSLRNLDLDPERWHLKYRKGRMRTKPVFGRRRNMSITAPTPRKRPLASLRRAGYGIAYITRLGFALLPYEVPAQKK
jgi:hypothetical protein